MISFGPFPWQSSTAILAFNPISIPVPLAVQWYCLHRSWLLDVNLTEDFSGITNVGSHLIEWNYRTMDNTGGPPTAKEQLPAGYQIRALTLPLSGSPITVSFFSALLGDTPEDKSGVNYQADLSLGARPFLLMQTSVGTTGVTTNHTQIGDVNCAIDGVNVPVAGSGCSGFITLAPFSDWDYSGE